MTSTVSLEPDAIPPHLKVIIFGDRLLYYLLSAYDPEIGEFFKVLADFEDEFERTPETEATHARLIASLLAQEQLKPIDRDGVALVLDENAHRMLRIRDRALDAILREIALIDTTGKKAGQVNGHTRQPREAAADDIIAVIEPQNAIERVTHQFIEGLDAAFGSPSSILLVPGHVRQLSGPIAAVAGGADDPGVAAAFALAASTGERMVLVPIRAPIDPPLGPWQMPRFRGMTYCCRPISRGAC